LRHCLEKVRILTDLSWVRERKKLQLCETMNLIFETELVRGNLNPLALTPLSLSLSLSYRLLYHSRPSILPSQPFQRVQQPWSMAYRRLQLKESESDNRRKRQQRLSLFHRLRIPRATHSRSACSPWTRTTTHPRRRRLSVCLLQPPLQQQLPPSRPPPRPPPPRPRHVSRLPHRALPLPTTHPLQPTPHARAPFSRPTGRKSPASCQRHDRAETRLLVLASSLPPCLPRLRLQCSIPPRLQRPPSRQPLSFSRRLRAISASANENRPPQPTPRAQCY